MRSSRLREVLRPLFWMGLPAGARALGGAWGGVRRGWWLGGGLVLKAGPFSLALQPHKGQLKHKTVSGDSI